MGLFEVGDAERCQLPCTAGEFFQHGHLGIDPMPGGDQIVQLSHDIRRNNEMTAGGRDGLADRGMVRLRGVKKGEERAGVDDGGDGASPIPEAPKELIRAPCDRVAPGEKPSGWARPPIS